METAPAQTISFDDLTAEIADAIASVLAQNGVTISPYLWKPETGAEVVANMVSRYSDRIV